ncbi:MAG: family 16 glycosylhydrolase [Gammaproteobacteria bacterium]|nr:family 16 glycosylhydrolase [Gammaproteobacteria bacterium]
MKFRSQASLRLAASLAALLVVSACSDNRLDQLSAVETIDIPAADAGPQANQNINNPTLEIPVTYPVADGDVLTLVWQEEFDGPEIDPETWFFATGDGTEKGLPGGWGNNELQYYLPDNAMIVNGVLEITARRETVGDLNYTSARINTEDRFAFKYGRIEASIKMPSGQGLWPAFWMLSQDSDYVCDENGRPCIWAAIGEIDIVEAINLDGTNGNEIFATIHYGGEFPANQSSSETYTPTADVTEDFHTYALEWDETQLRWYFDGQLYAVQNNWSSAALNEDYPAPFNQNFHILLNLAVGGNFPGSPNGTTPFPATMEVDWVRVYSGEPPPPTGPEATSVDFEAAPASYDFGAEGGFGGGASDVFANPDMGGLNSSAQTARMQKFAGEPFGGSTLTLPGGAIDFAAGEAFKLKVWASKATTLTFKLEGADDAGDRERLLDHSGDSMWQELCADFTGDPSSSPTTGITFIFDNGTPGDAANDAGWIFYYDEIEQVESCPTGGGPGGSGELTVNGDFEAGDTSGWTLFTGPPNNGTFTATMAEANGGLWSGNLVASVPAGGGDASFPVVKQANIGVGMVQPDSTVTVSFDLRGSIAGTGGVIFVEFFSELSGGGTSQAGIISQPVPTDSWMNYSIPVTTGNDVSGGVTLQLKADCGANPGCTVDAYFDNVSVVVAE